MNEHHDPCRDQNTEIKSVCLRVGDGFYALNIKDVREIIRPLPILPIPKAPPYIDGVINLRNAAIPVIDLRRRFDLPHDEQDRLQRMIICAVQGRMISLVVNEVTEIRSFRHAEIQPVPFYLAGETAQFFPGVCRHGDRLFMLLDLQNILSSHQAIDGSELNRQLLIGGKGEFV